MLSSFRFNRWISGGRIYCRFTFVRLTKSIMGALYRGLAVASVVLAGLFYWVVDWAWKIAP